MPRFASLFFASILTCCATSHGQSVTARVGEEVTLGIGSTVTLDRALQIHVASVSEDSRCPSDATCVWAGQLKFLLSVTSNGKSSTLELMESEPQTVDSYRLHFVRALPAARAKAKIPADEYRLTLRVDRAG